jgi:hypothetical protein
MVSREVTKEGGSDAQLPPIQASGASVVVPDAHLLFTAEFSRIGDDLLLTGQDGTILLIKDYFALDVPPMLLSPLGAMLPELAAAFVGWMRAVLSPPCPEELHKGVKTITDGSFVN